MHASRAGQTARRFRTHDKLGSLARKTLMRTLSLLCCVAACAFAQGRGPRPTPPVPALGIEVPAADRAELEAGLKRLQSAAGKLATNPLAADVLIYQEAVRYALQY